MWLNLPQCVDDAQWQTTPPPRAKGVNEVYDLDTKTMWPMKNYVDKLTVQNKRNCPRTMGAFQKLFAKQNKGIPPLPVAAPTSLPPLLKDAPKNAASSCKWMEIPSLASIKGYEDSAKDPDLKFLFNGGETEALSRLKSMVTEQPGWVAAFEKPKTSPNPASDAPTTTALSPFVAIGALSVRTFWHAVDDAQKRAKTKATAPPVSLHGQLLWREFYHLCAHCVGKDFDKMTPGNWMCRAIPWEGDADPTTCLESDTLAKAWAEGRTGYPWIDAAMTELRQTGWMHHLARHAVACFLTRGDLWRSWEVGQLVFHRHLVDYDWALNAGNWMWLSCSGFFYQYFRVYSPVAFAQKTDMTKRAEYIRRWQPHLKKMPQKFIYDPHKCPKDTLRGLKLIVGKNMPKYIVDHKTSSEANKSKMAEAYKEAKKLAEEGK